MTSLAGDMVKVFEQQVEEFGSYPQARKGKLLV
jgi:hypothetical protein